MQASGGLGPGKVDRHWRSNVAHVLFAEEERLVVLQRVEEVRREERAEQAFGQLELSYCSVLPRHARQGRALLLLLRHVCREQADALFEARLCSRIAAECKQINLVLTSGSYSIADPFATHIVAVMLSGLCVRDVGIAARLQQLRSCMEG